MNDAKQGGAFSASPLSLADAFVFACAIAVVNGFGRFAYALLLPPMRSDLEWDYALSGWLNTANSLGYGAGALAGLVLLARWRAASLFGLGLALTVATIAACAFTRDLGLMMVWRFVCGVGSAWVFACGGALVAARYGAQPARAAAATAIFYAGGGLGMVASGALLWPVLQGAWAWPLGWAALGVAGLALSVWPAVLARRAPPGPAATAPGSTSAPSNNEPVLPVHWRHFWPTLVAYVCFGAGYIVYLTFVVAWLRDLALDVNGQLAVWMLLGAAVIASGFIWRGPMARWWPTHTFAAASVCTAVGTALPLLNGSLATLVASALLVGGSFFMVPSSVLALVRRLLPQAQWATAMNGFTFVFAMGQALGPVLAGALADAYSLNVAMAFGAITLVAGALLAQAQRRSV